MPQQLRGTDQTICHDQIFIVSGDGTEGGLPILIPTKYERVIETIMANGSRLCYDEGAYALW